ncbi:MAG: DUF4126 domain-containing protein [Betaproteobacteria bacterium]|nr:DUF4126 domain-containing protein [Betaproteobacteria bacterium]
MIEHLPDIALAAALAWASGIRLYAVLFLLGLSGYAELIELPERLSVLAHPLVLSVSGFLLLAEFFADKIPGFDTLWDAVHTFIRIPAGAALAASVFGADSYTWSIAAGLLGGAITSGAHFAKAGTRTLANTSPEPFSNWTLSFTEDLLVPAGLWIALTYPVVFLGALLLFLLLLILLLPMLWRGVAALVAALRRTAV